MLILRGKPLPAELEPLRPIDYEQLFAKYFLPARLAPIRAELLDLDREWPRLAEAEALACLDDLHGGLFGGIFPAVRSKLTYARVRYSASFHSDGWDLRFSQNHFSANFSNLFKTWLHENFHAFLHFHSLRLNPSQAQRVLQVPAPVLQAASQRGPLVLPELLFAEKNLLGMMDRQLTNARTGSVGLDSYYLNVEILTEDLTEKLYLLLKPAFRYQRSYARAQDYIERRFRGLPPVQAYL